MTAAVYTLTLLISSSLLFFVQPMVGKILLPALGGTPAIWNTCMMFFQAVLLVGYLYAHLLSRFQVRAQLFVHLSIVFLAFFFLPIDIQLYDVVTTGGLAPILWLLGTLVVYVALPFFVVSTSAPLLQSWFSRTDHPHAHDPYFLYAASNVGSLTALIAYPLFAEPLTTLSQQRLGWMIAYVLFAVGIVACATILVIRARKTPQVLDEKPVTQMREDQPPTWRQRARWVFLAFIPSSLMLGLTTYITTDLASFPLLWVVPLALYLATFIIVFGKLSWQPTEVLARAMSLIITILLVAFVIEATHPAWLVMTLHIIGFFLAALIAHAKLASLRPAARRLTDYFLWVSVGGLAGGVFNAMIAPFLFTRIWEYPLVLILACAIRAPSTTKPGHVLLRFSPVYVAALATISYMGARAAGFVLTDPIGLLAIFGPATLLAYSQVERPLRFSANLLVLALTMTLLHPSHFGQLSFAQRNFFGQIRVAEDDRFRSLVDGNTLHGQVDLGALSRGECLPLTYFHAQSPFADALAAYRERDLPETVATIGLGAGSMACHSRAHERWRWFEINPAVVHVARDTPYFQLLEMAAAPQEVILGDARLNIAELEDASLGLLAIDAFSSNSIPAHLITAEALELYFEKLAEGGFVVIHVSNRYLTVSPILANTAAALDLQAYYGFRSVDDEELSQGKTASEWVVIAREDPGLGPDWFRIRVTDRRPWTDEYSNLLHAIFP